MSSPPLVVLTHDEIFKKHASYTFRQLYHASGMIANGYKYKNADGAAVSDLKQRWESLGGAGIHEAYLRAALRACSLWKQQNPVLRPTTQPYMIELEYRHFIQRNIPQCLGYILEKELPSLAGMYLPRKNVPVSLGPFDDPASCDLFDDVLYQQTEDFRHDNIILSNGAVVNWNRLGGDAIEVIYSRTRDMARNEWDQGLRKRDYRYLYARVKDMLGSSLIAFAEERIAQGRTDIVGTNVRTVTPTNSTTGRSERSSVSSGYNPTADMDMD